MVYYLAEYGESNNKRDLSFSPAGVAKMDYVISAVKRSGASVKVISTCRTKKQKGIFRGGVVKKDNAQENIYRFTFGSKTKVGLLLDRMMGMIWICFFAFRNVSKADTVIVYHMVHYLRWISLLHKILRFKLVYEVEELYGFYQNDKKTVDKEIRYLQKSDAYIFSNGLLEKVVNKRKKPYVIIHGSYDTLKQNERKREDNIIHCIYAGTFSKNKGGAKIAVECAKNLSSDYCIHVTGFGSVDEVETIKKKIEEMNAHTDCKVIFEGFLDEADLRDLLFRCDIGLATQDSQTELNSYCFQSKTLNYLKHGLRVVTSDSEVMRDSDVSDFLYFYQENSAKSIADTIAGIDVSKDYSPDELLDSLDERVVKWFHGMLA